MLRPPDDGASAHGAAEWGPHSQPLRRAARGPGSVWAACPPTRRPAHSRIRRSLPGFYQTLGFITLFLREFPSGPAPSDMRCVKSPRTFRVLFTAAAGGSQGRAPVPSPRTACEANMPAVAWGHRQGLGKFLFAASPWPPAQPCSTAVSQVSVGPPAPVALPRPRRRPCENNKGSRDESGRRQCPRRPRGLRSGAMSPRAAHMQRAVCWLPLP